MLLSHSTRQMPPFIVTNTFHYLFSIPNNIYSGIKIFEKNEKEDETTEKICQRIKLFLGVQNKRQKRNIFYQFFIVWCQIRLAAIRMNEKKKFVLFYSVWKAKFFFFVVFFFWHVARPKTHSETEDKRQVISISVLLMRNSVNFSFRFHFHLEN